LGKDGGLQGTGLRGGGACAREANKARTSHAKGRAKKDVFQSDHAPKDPRAKQAQYNDFMKGRLRGQRGRGLKCAKKNKRTIKRRLH